MASFGGTAFGERGNNAATFPRWKRAAVFSVTQIPGGNTTILQSGGRTADTLSLRVRCTEAQLTALYAKVDTTATLVIAAGTRSAYLAAIEVEEVLAGRDVFFATLELVGR
jgi:hypothetical protein